MAFSDWSLKTLRETKNRAITVLTKDGVEVTDERSRRLREISDSIAPYFKEIDRKFNEMMKDYSREYHKEYNNEWFKFPEPEEQKPRRHDKWNPYFQEYLNPYAPKPIPNEFPKFVKQPEDLNFQPSFYYSSNSTSNAERNLTVSDSTVWSGIIYDAGS